MAKAGSQRTDEDTDELEDQTGSKGKSGADASGEDTQGGGSRADHGDTGTGLEDDRLAERGESEGEDESEEGLSPEELESRREANRLRKRQKRDRQRQRQDNERREMQRLRQQNQDLERRLSNVEQHGQSSQIAGISAKLEEATDYLSRARSLKKELLQSDDPTERAKVEEVDEAIYAARRTIENLQSYKTQAERVASRPAPADRVVVERAHTFHKEHAWYDPNARDADSRILRQLDQGLAEDGFDPRTDEYWQQLRRLGKQYLPHRFKSKSADADEDDGGDEDVSEESGSAERARTAGKRPPALVGGSGRSGGSDAGGKGGSKLSAARSEALIAAGYEPNTPEWDRMIKRYKADDVNRRTEQRGAA